MILLGDFFTMSYLCSIIWYTSILILFVKQKYINIVLFKINPLCEKYKPYVKKPFYISLLCLYNRLYLVLEVLSKKNYRKKGVA